MLNFGMVDSPNSVRFVYDGDGSGTGTVGPNGSDVIEDVFLDYFASIPCAPGRAPRAWCHASRSSCASLGEFGLQVGDRAS
jgi:glyoxylate carboligase